MFTTSGQVVGVITTIDSSLENEQAAPRGMMAMIQSMMSGGSGTPAPPFVLPARVVKGSLAQATTRAAELLTERAAKKDGDGGDKQDD